MKEWPTPSTERAPLIAGRQSDRVIELFARGEAFDHQGFADQFTDDAIYQFANAANCRTSAEIAASTQAFFSQIQALYHGIRSLTEVGDTVFVEMDVVYWRHDGSSVELPCADIVRFAGDRVAELRIFMDAAPIADPALPPATTASVRLQRGGDVEELAGTMHHFFAKTEGGRARIAAGYPPKWSITGPKWMI